MVTERALTRMCSVFLMANCVLHVDCCSSTLYKKAWDSKTVRKMSFIGNEAPAVFPDLCIRDRAFCIRGSMHVDDACMQHICTQQTNDGNVRVKLLKELKPCGPEQASRIVFPYSH